MRAYLRKQSWPVNHWNPMMTQQIWSIFPALFRVHHFNPDHQPYCCDWYYLLPTHWKRLKSNSHTLMTDDLRSNQSWKWVILSLNSGCFLTWLIAINIFTIYTIPPSPLPPPSSSKHHKIKSYGEKIILEEKQLRQPVKHYHLTQHHLYCCLVHKCKMWQIPILVHCTCGILSCVHTSKKQFATIFSFMFS